MLHLFADLFKSDSRADEALPHNMSGCSVIKESADAANEPAKLV